MRVQHHTDIGGVFLKADDLVLQLCSELLPAEAEVAEGVVYVSKKLAAGNVHVSSDGLKGQDAVSCLGSVGLLVDRKAPKDCGIARVRIHACCAIDVLDIDSADFRCFLGRHGGDSLRQLFEAVAETIDEVVVVQVFLDDDVEHRHAERRVGAGAKGKVVRCACCKPIGSRVDRDELASALHAVDYGVPEESVTVRRQGLFAPRNHNLGNFIGGIFVAPCQAACIIHLGIRDAGNVGCSRDAWDIACIARLGIAGIGGADHRHAVRSAHRSAFSAGSAEHDDGLRTVLLLDSADILLDDVVGIFPCGAFPLVLSAVFLRALHRVDDAVGMIGEVRQRQAAHAKAALRDGLVLVAFNLFEDAVFIHVEFDSASNGVTSRRRPSAPAGDGVSILFPLPRLA